MNQIAQYIDKGTIVRIRTTNGGESTVKLLEDYRPSYGVYVQDTFYGGRMESFMPAWRIKSIEVIFNYWNAPMSDAEVADTLGRLALDRSLRRLAA